jgi:hypothetical protein
VNSINTDSAQQMARPSRLVLRAFVGSGFTRVTRVMLPFGFLVFSGAVHARTYVPGTGSAPSTSVSSFSLSLPSRMSAGVTIPVGFDFAAASVSSSTYSQGNAFTKVGRQLISFGLHN